MSDWDASDNEDAVAAPLAANITIPVITPGQWDDEDVEDDSGVKDDWDASDDEDSKPKKTAAVPVSKPKKKKTLQEKIAERQAEEQRKKEEAMKKRESQNTNETPEERKRREELSIRESDLQNAKDLFGVDDSDMPARKESFIDTMKPESKAEFDKFNSQLLEKLRSFEKSTHFAYFVESLTRDLAVSLTVDDIKKLSSSLNVLANEKAKASKPSSSKKKSASKAKGGAVLKSAPGGGPDTTNYDDVYDDYDDFM